MQERVDQGAAAVARGWVDHHSGWFVQHDEMAIFKQDVERDVLRLKRNRGRRWRREDDSLADPQPLPWFG
jgi:hypothetical protein